MEDSAPSAPGRFSRAFTFRMILLIAFVAGGIAGFGGFVFDYAEGSSYLTDDPAACVNCHVMRGVYDAWNHGSHKAVAKCGDCHVPDNFLAHWAVRGLNGWNHGRAFTLGSFHEPIQISGFNKEVARESCLRCHGDLTALMDRRDASDPTDCLRCHADAGHDD
jgi:cytochrome c nitrite reductase small subunit